MVTTNVELHSFIRVLLLFFLISCKQNQDSQLDKKVVYLNSYHLGYPASDEILQGISQQLQGKGVEVKAFFLNTKKESDSSQIATKVAYILAQIAQYQPDLIIASDDAAVQYVIAPHFRKGKLPVVFCGVNWTAVPYNLPADHITGMLEVLPLRKNLQRMLTYFPQAKKLWVLSENSLSEKKNTQVLDTLYKNLGFTVSYHLVDDFASWQSSFIEANQKADVIYLPTNGAIKNWDENEAKTFVKTQIRKPVITCDDFMMPYCVYGLSKIAQEQGEWAGKTALAILNGVPPANIPITTNQKSQSLINRTLAEKAGFKPSPALLEQSRIVN